MQKRSIFKLYFETMRETINDELARQPFITNQSPPSPFQPLNWSTMTSREATSHANNTIEDKTEVFFINAGLPLYHGKCLMVYLSKYSTKYCNTAYDKRCKV